MIRFGDEYVDINPPKVPKHMAIHPLESDKPVIVYLDIKSPYGLVAYRPT